MIQPITTILSFLAAGMCCLVAGCKTEEIEPTVRLLLTNRNQKVWVISTMKKNGNPMRLETCNTDNQWICRNDNTMEFNPGFIRCRLDEQPVIRRWTLNGTNNTLYLRRLSDIPGSTTERVEKHRILKITQDTLRLEQTEEDIYGTKVDVYERLFLSRQ